MIQIDPSDDLIDMAFKVCTALDQAGIRAILTGGSAATAYAPHAYQSSDADFIAPFRTQSEKFAAVIASLGFEKEGRIYIHPLIVPTLDFPDDEVLIGDEFIRSYSTLKREDFLLHVLTPTDCVRDRLSWFYFYNDRSALKAAVAVASVHPIDLDLVERWSAREGRADRFREFAERLER